MDVSKVMLVCPNCSKPTRVGIRRENGKVERICKKCGKLLRSLLRKKKKKRRKRKKEVKKIVKSKSKSKTKKE
jgi:Zn ribbon nucleic-acid-binding protein